MRKGIQWFVFVSWMGSEARKAFCIEEEVLENRQTHELNKQIAQQKRFHLKPSQTTWQCKITSEIIVIDEERTDCTFNQ